MVFFVRITVNQSHLRPICKSTKFNPKIQRTIYLINFQQLRLHVPDFIRTVVYKNIKKGRNMSNNYYAGNVIYNNQHKELTIQGNLSAQQMMKIAKDFFADETEVTEENYEAEVTEKASETNEAAGEGFQKELFHFVHPALDEDEGWKVHKEVERLVKQFDVQEICKRLNILKKEGKVLLPQNTKNAHEELIRMGMPIEKGRFGYKTFCKYYNKD